MSEMSMNDYAPFEGIKKIITKYDAKQKQKHVREGIVFELVQLKSTKAQKDVNNQLDCLMFDC